MWTIDDVMATNPCYDRERVKALFAGRERLSVSDILNLEIEVDDRLWAICKLSTIVQERIKEEFFKHLRNLTHLQADIQAWVNEWLAGHEPEANNELPRQNYELYEVTQAYRGRHWFSVLIWLCPGNSTKSVYYNLIKFVRECHGL